MNVEAATMTVPWGEAQTAYRAYRQAVKTHTATKDDVAIYRAYHALLSGRKVIDAGHAIAHAGLYDDGLPKLAIARADWDFVHAWWYDQRCVFTKLQRKWSSAGERQQSTHNVNVRFHEQPRDRDVTSKAQVPSIPPQFRPTGALSGYRLLFEAVWERKPAVDPLLLKHIEGPFYVVLAAWDLSPIEQAVLRARL